MTSQVHGEITLLLHRLGQGDREVLSELAPLLVAELRRIAANHLRDKPGHTWEPTDLVNELWLRLLEREELCFTNRAHFIGVSAHLMRVMVIDHARQRCARKRKPTTLPPPAANGLSALLDLTEGKAAELVALDEAIERLAARHPRQAEIVEMRYFGGLTVEETSQALGLSEKTVKREWSAARAWLHRELRGIPL
jgi:RNA polymerase sigma factor (TIGR02999 family)